MRLSPQARCTLPMGSREAGTDGSWTLRWREPDSNFWSLKSIQLGGVNAGRHGGAYLFVSTRTSHKSGCAAMLSLEGSHTLSGKAGQLQA